MNRFAFYLQFVLSAAYGAITMFLCMTGLGGSLSNIGVAFVLVLFNMLLALVVHELGHYAGARLRGMTVSEINIAGVEFHAQRHGWRVRWGGRIKYRGVLGYVRTYPVHGLPIRPQKICSILGGPVGNLIAAAVSGVLGWMLWPGPVGGLSCAFAVVNTGMALTNLVPHQGALPSDGLQLLAWLRRPNEHASSFAYMRLMSRSLAGQTADEVPEDDLVALEQQSAPMRLVAEWIRLKADQNRGAWAQAVARGAQIDVLARPFDPQEEMLATLRTELAFSQAMLTRNGAGLVDDLLPDRAAWTSPWLRPRYQALSAALQGDHARCVQLLSVSKRWAENSIDREVPRSEAVLRGYVVATFGDQEGFVRKGPSSLDEGETAPYFKSISREHLA